MPNRDIVGLRGRGHVVRLLKNAIAFNTRKLYSIVAGKYSCVMSHV